MNVSELFTAPIKGQRLHGMTNVISMQMQTQASSVVLKSRENGEKKERSRRTREVQHK